jgi:hypothetical protein
MTAKGLDIVFSLFAFLYPAIWVDVHVAASVELKEKLDKGDLDMFDAGNCFNCYSAYKPQ